MMRRKPIDLNDCRTLTPEQKRLNNWRLNQLMKLGIVTGYDSIHNDEAEQLKIKIFGSDLNHDLAEAKAIEYINKGQNVPKELDDKLIQYKEAIEKLK